MRVIFHSFVVASGRLVGNTVEDLQLCKKNLGFAENSMLTPPAAIKFSVKKRTFVLWLEPNSLSVLMSSGKASRSWVM